MIPEDKTEAVYRGLRQAFDTTAIEDSRKIAQGLGSDLVFRIIVQDSPYLLRIMTRMDERNDPVRIFACMKAAAEADLSPRVLYASSEDGIAITDFTEAVPIPPSEALLLLPETLRRLHALPPFPKSFNYVTAHNFFIWKLRGAALLPAPEVEEVFCRYAQICATYPRLDADLVSCHMDLKPENILFDGRRIRLQGWQAALRNDRYFDLAVAANFLVTGGAEERTYLEAYFGQPPDDYQASRFFLMRQVVHMLSAAVFLILGAAGKPIPPGAAPPSFRDFHARLWRGEIDLADNNRKLDYGIVHWNQMLENIRHPRFDDSLRIVSERSPTAEAAQLLLPSAP